MSEQLNGTAIRQQLIECAEELSHMQSSEKTGYTEIEQRHGRADGKLVGLRDRNGAPVLAGVQEGHSNSESFVGSLGGICLGCPVLKAGDGCALRESFHQLTAQRRAKSEQILGKLGARSDDIQEAAKPVAKKSRRNNKSNQDAPLTVTFLPVEQRTSSESEEAKRSRQQKILERTEALDDMIKSIYLGAKRNFGYAGTATRHTSKRNELNQDHTDHISSDD